MRSTNGSPAHCSFGRSRSHRRVRSGGDTDVTVLEETTTTTVPTTTVPTTTVPTTTTTIAARTSATRCSRWHGAGVVR